MAHPLHERLRMLTESGEWDAVPCLVTLDDIAHPWSRYLNVDHEPNGDDPHPVRLTFGRTRD